MGPIGGSETGAEFADSLAELMARYQAGDEVAFEALYEQLAASLRGYLRTIVGPGTAVEDLVQNTFLQLHKSRRSYLRGEPVRPWVFAIARHVGLMARRSAGRRSQREVLQAEYLPEVSTAPETVTSVDRLALENALGTLADPGREALWLHHVQGFSFREIASVQGISLTAAKVRAHRALANLRELFATEGL